MYTVFVYCLLVKFKTTWAERENNYLPTSESFGKRLQRKQNYIKFGTLENPRSTIRNIVKKMKKQDM